MRISDWSSDVCSSDLAFANPRGGIVLRAVARAAITAVFAARLAFLVAQRHAAEMRAHAAPHQPVLVAFLGALLARLRLSKVRHPPRIVLGAFLRRQVTHEHRRLARALRPHWAPSALDHIPSC